MTNFIPGQRWISIAEPELGLGLILEVSDKQVTVFFLLTMKSSNSKVTREALRGWMGREQRLTMLDTSIAKGVADAEAGRTQEIGSVREELQQIF